MFWFFENCSTISLNDLFFDKYLKKNFLYSRFIISSFSFTSVFQIEEVYSIQYSLHTIISISIRSWSSFQVCSPILLYPFLTGSVSQHRGIMTFQVQLYSFPKNFLQFSLLFCQRVKLFFQRPSHTDSLTASLRAEWEPSTAFIHRVMLPEVQCSACLSGKFFCWAEKQ